MRRFGAFRSSGRAGGGALSRGSAPLRLFRLVPLGFHFASYLLFLPDQEDACFFTCVAGVV
jgi:hypothetical protein